MQSVVTASLSAKGQARRRWLALALRALWIAVLVLSVESLLVSIGPGYARLTTVCTVEPCDTTQLTPVGLHALEDLGWSVQGYAFFQLALVVLIAIVYGAISILIFRARPHDPFALFVSLTLLLFGVFMSEHISVIATVHPLLEYVATFAPIVALICLAILFYLFPDGRFVPRWTRWAATGWVALPVGLLVYAFFWEYTDALDVVDRGRAAAPGGDLCDCAHLPLCQGRQSHPTPTDQVGHGRLFAVAPDGGRLCRVAAQFHAAGRCRGDAAVHAEQPIQVVSLTIVPVTIGLALLRHRLWDVDLIINRSLVYVPLTSILAVIYTTSLSVSEKLFTTASGEQPPAVIIFTTIILTTTFSPIRNGLQGVVDRYFKEPPDPLKPLKEMERQVTEVAQILDRRSRRAAS